MLGRWRPQTGVDGCHELRCRSQIGTLVGRMMLCNLCWMVYGLGVVWTICVEAGRLSIWEHGCASINTVCGYYDHSYRCRLVSWIQGGSLDRFHTLYRPSSQSDKLDLTPLLPSRWITFLNFPACLTLKPGRPELKLGLQRGKCRPWFPRCIVRPAPNSDPMPTQHPHCLLHTAAARSLI